ncbi:orotate phosphoribosyltransferase, partial [Candidatus Curtissbacteria bacterium]|nr:orotate phosphoribosyltransferase [Candidatus Curtissbacteria bacterium]
RNLGATVTDEVAIFTYGLRESEDNLKKAQVTLHTLTDLKRSTVVAVKKGFLMKDQVKLIFNWAKDPQSWGKKMGFE